MKSYVVDASVAVKWYLPEPQSDEAALLLQRMSGGELQAHAPDLFLFEVSNVLWKRFRSRELMRKNVHEILQTLEAVPITFHSAKALATSALELACELHRTVYDSSYLALAIGLECEFITADQRLCRAVGSSPWRGHVRQLGDIPA